ncbi:FCD domain-containing protein, partial [uncultured Nitratireductor sp.]|uniref:FCD domain-containing protein n=1 Tax=uncultured Nitratireductor sp. TaxID=520953 RepID=UPI003458D01D
ERLEHDLHVDILLRCDNAQLRDTIRRSQLPTIIAAHSTFKNVQGANEIAAMLDEHLTIFDQLIAGRREAAMQTLEAHLRRSMEPNVALLEKLRFAEPSNLPPYLVPTPR